MGQRQSPKGLELESKGGWADVDLGASLRIDSIRLYPQNPANFPTRFTLEGSDNLQFDNPNREAGTYSRFSLIPYLVGYNLFYENTGFCLHPPPHLRFSAVGTGRQHSRGRGRLD